MDFLNLLKPKATHSRNGFDLSRKHVFSSKAGQLKPCLAVETVPGDTFEIDVTGLTRSMTLNTAAFLRGKQRYDFFFVPYSQLWHPFNQFISQRTDKHSSRQLNHNYVPVISLKDLLDYIYLVYTDQDAASFNGDVHGYDCTYGMVDLLNLLGYGDFSFIFNHDYTQDEISQIIQQYSGKYVNVFRLAAYQHIWYDYYRNKYYDVDSTGGILTYDQGFFSSVSMFNFDDINCGTFSNSIINVGDPTDDGDPDAIRIFQLMQPRYVQYKKDLFTSALPGQQFGAVSSVDVLGLTSNDIGRWHDKLSTSLSSGPVSTNYADQQLLISEVANITHDHSITSLFDVLSLRKAEMLQVWKQRTLRAGNMVDDSFEAHYGVKPYYESDNNVHYLGSFSAALQINSVESTANAGQTLNGKVGDIAATGTCVVGGNKIRFECKDFGVIMCLASFLPESEYNAVGLDKANTLHEQFDFFTPEFENIGLEAIPYREIRFSKNQVVNSEKTIGYAPRYWMYKEGRDKVFGEFMNSIYTDYDKSLTPWVAPRKIVFKLDGLGNYLNDLTNLYVNPNIMNNIFAIAANSTPLTDCFINNVYFDIKAIRPMSELGLPQF